MNQEARALRGLLVLAAALVGSTLARLAPALRFVLEQKTVDDADDGVLFFWRELGDGLEMQPQRVVRSAFVVVEQQRIGADVHRYYDPLKDLDRWLRSARKNGVRLIFR